MKYLCLVYGEEARLVAMSKTESDALIEPERRFLEQRLAEMGER